MSRSRRHSAVSSRMTGGSQKLESSTKKASRSNNTGRQPSTSGRQQMESTTAGTQQGKIESSKGGRRRTTVAPQSKSPETAKMSGKHRRKTTQPGPVSAHIVEYYQFMGVFDLSQTVDSSSRQRSRPYRCSENTYYKCYGYDNYMMDFNDESSHSLTASLREIRADTPDTYIPDIPSFPDIGIFCKECDIYIRIEQINDHRTYHKALKEMRFKGSDRPHTLAILQKRRKLLLRKLVKVTGVSNDVETMDPKLVAKINAAYEVLKVDLEDTQESQRSVTRPEKYILNGQSLDCSLKCVLGVGVCSYENARWKSSMEDAKVFQDHFGNDPKKCFLAIYDGHHGKFAADIASHELHHSLLREMRQFDRETTCTCALNMVEHNDISKYRISHHLIPKESDGKELVHSESSNNILQVLHKCGEVIYDVDLISVNIGRIEQLEAQKKEKRTPRMPEKVKSEYTEKLKLAFKKCYYRVDRLLSYGQNEHSRVRWSGCSAITVILQDNLKDPEKCCGHDELSADECQKEGKGTKQIGTLHVANAGDSQAILVRANIAYRVSKDHSLNNPNEKTRIEKLGGFASESERQLRVNGLLTATRSLGNHGDPKLKNMISCEPQSSTVPIDEYAQFLILASNGLWEIFSPDEAADLISQMLPSNEIPPPDVPNTSIGLLISRYNKHLQTLDTREQPDACSPHYFPVQSPIFEEQDEELSLLALDPTNSNVDTPSVVLENDGSNEMHRDEIKIERSFSGKTVVAPSRGSLRTPNNELNHKSDRRLSFADDHEVNTFENNDGEESEHEDVSSSHESGNEADVDTNTDFMSIRADSPPSPAPPTQAEIHKEFAQNMAQRLVHAALIAGARDNITCMVVLFPGSGI